MAEERGKETDAGLVNGEGKGGTTEEADSTATTEDSGGTPGQDKATENSNSDSPSSECEPPIIIGGDEGTPPW